jgi:hypothetical protein
MRRLEKRGRWEGKGECAMGETKTVGRARPIHSQKHELVP